VDADEYLINKLIQKPFDSKLAAYQFLRFDDSQRGQSSGAAVDQPDVRRHNRCLLWFATIELKFRPFKISNSLWRKAPFSDANRAIFAGNLPARIQRNQYFYLYSSTAAFILRLPYRAYENNHQPPDFYNHGAFVPRGRTYVYR
jgi:hypothetical protein